MNKVNGLVEAVGTKFNGSLKLNGQWYNLKKGTKNVANVGDNVTLGLETWEYKGKTGENVTSIDVLAVAHKDEAPVETKKAYKPFKKEYTPSTGRDFDAENRGKTRCQLVAASMPLILSDAVKVKDVKAIVNELVEYIFKGE